MRKGDKVVMTREAVENYGEQYRDVPLVITHVATKYMPSKTFFAQKMPDGYHPGYDEAAGGQELYDFEDMEFSLYEWEVVPFEEEAC